MGLAKRVSPRLRCSIDVLACTTILSLDARIIDVSPGGAKVQMADPYQRGTRIHLDVEGDYYWGTVMWDEVDRMGVRFHTPVKTGALHRLLQELQAPMRGPARPTAAFGRRAGAPAQRFG